MATAVLVAGNAAVVFAAGFSLMMGMILQFPPDDSLDEELTVGTGMVLLLLLGHA